MRNCTMYEVGILASLQEAGEDWVIPLAKAVFRLTKSKVDTGEFLSALRRLRLRGFVTYGHQRNEKTKDWMSLTRVQEEYIENEIESALLVSGNGSDLRWPDGYERYAVLLTEKGEIEAECVLIRYGWDLNDAW